MQVLKVVTEITGRETREDDTFSFDGFLFVGLGNQVSNYTIHIAIQKVISLILLLTI